MKTSEIDIYAHTRPLDRETHTSTDLDSKVSVRLMTESLQIESVNNSSTNLLEFMFSGAELTPVL